MPVKKTPHEQMSDWPRSWAGFDADELVGQRMVDELEPFVAHLVQSGLTKKTIQRHLSSLWSIGGEIIRDVHDDPKRRRWTGRKLLEVAIQYGEAPVIRNADEAEQAEANRTARKLSKFLSS